MAKRKKAGLSAKGKLLLKKYLARSQYNVVDGHSNIVEQSTTENRIEDEVLDHSKRMRLLQLTRNLVRNSSLFNTLLTQLTTNVISTCGGKVILSIPNEDTNSKLLKSFKDYTRNVDFYTGDNFNHLLKRSLREIVIGGDCVLLFDDGLVEDSGKVLLFESSEMVDVPQNEIEKRYGKGSYVRQGKVYSQYGRNIGVVLSKSQGGLCSDQVNPNRCYYLKKDPNSNPLDNNWFLFSSNWREGRGISQAASAISTIHQLEDLTASELLASRRNAQLFCWLEETPDKYDAQIPSAFDPSIDYSSMTDEQIEELVKEQSAQDEVKNVSFTKAHESQIVYEALPPGYKANQLATQHPNSNVQTLVDFLANRCAASMGLSKVYATGNPSDADYRSNQLFSWGAILEFQHDIEQICDWCFYRWLNWSIKKGEITAYVAQDIMNYVDWEWTSIDSLDQVSEQRAVEMKLRNMTSTLKNELGNDWKEQLKQYKTEIDYCRENGLPHPAFNMISGGERHESFADTAD